MDIRNFPRKQGLYLPDFEKDSCGTGFVCDINGRRTNALVRAGLSALKKLSHRGGAGADPETGDGAGILIQTPDRFFREEARKNGIELPPPGMYASGLVLLPRDEKTRLSCKEAISAAAREEGLELIGWRKVPVEEARAGETARETMPFFEQPFIARYPGTAAHLNFECALYAARKRAENFIRGACAEAAPQFYICGLSAKTFSYKGLLKAEQLPRFFTDLRSRSLESAICLLHARYSTNTFPSWSLAQPFRMLAHNGEINTISGNEKRFSAGEKLLRCAIPSEKILPVIEPGGSDSSSLDNVFELLCLSGRPMEHAVMMLMPEAWEKDKNMPGPLKSFYEFHGCALEPWDGPAAIAFTDGVKAGAALDRNGLRPARYAVYSDGLAVMASEAGVIERPAGTMLKSGRLEPGKMLIADTNQKRLFEDDEIKNRISRGKPYASWLRKNMISPGKTPVIPRNGKSVQPGQELFLLKLFGYTREDIGKIIRPMAEDGEEPIGSMGNDIPLAVLNRSPELLYSYFKQRFAQVTNPAIDPIRENSAMSLFCYTGPSGNLLEENPLQARKLKTPSPIISDGQLEKIKKLDTEGFRPEILPMLFKAGEGAEGFIDALEKLCGRAEAASGKGAGIIILSDRGADSDSAPLPALLAAGAVNQRLIGSSQGARAGIIVETAEAREVHHFALLAGCGADLVNPYMAFRVIRSLREEGALKISAEKAAANYIRASEKGILKILSRMGISTMQSYKGAQAFECLGLSGQVIDRCFPGMASRVGGMGFREIARETLARRESALNGERVLPAGGAYSWRRNGRRRAWNPDSIALLHSAVRNNDYSAYKEFTELANRPGGEPATIRALFKVKKTEPVPLEEVEPAGSILKRFAAGAMSFGSLSKEAHETIAAAMNRIGAISNSGEGGESPERFQPLPGGDSLRSAVKQVAAGRFGVTTHYLVNADEIQIKISQGAKPGEGGHLPGHKVSEVIARTRYTTPGITLISPPPHHDIYSIEDLAQLIFDLKNVNPQAVVSVKLVSEAGVGTVAAGAVKGHADKILISGGDGGTGASPLSSIRHAGLPWELGLAETHQTLVLNGLRERVLLQADGQFRTGRDAAVAAILGAEEFGFGTSILVSLGCLMLRHCHLDNCALGIATQDETLRRRFRGRPEHIINYMKFVAAELREIMAQAGVRKLGDLTGRTDLLEIDEKLLSGKARKLDLSGIMHRPEPAGKKFPHAGRKQKINPEVDRKLIKLSTEALEKGTPVIIECLIKNSDRAAGAMLSGRVCAALGEAGLPEDTITVKFRGAAGQSFGAFLARGITFELEGIANDYAGKGMFGGRIIMYPDRDAEYPAEENIIAGNTSFYGATRGEAYINGIAGERFCVRNSGITAVCEGTGDHGCEYMTGGTVIVLGKTGRNFAAGMSGGTAYVYDEKGSFPANCNTGMVGISRPDAEDAALLSRLLENHIRYTGSKKAARLLESFAEEAKKFRKVVPFEYRAMLRMAGEAEE